jgi:hypothetical protein
MGTENEELKARKKGGAGTAHIHMWTVQLVYLSKT